MRPIQYFSDDYLKQSKKSSPSQIADFLEEYIQLHRRTKQTTPPMQLISLRMPIHLLELLKRRAKLEGMPYQSLLKTLLEKSLIA